MKMQDDESELSISDVEYMQRYMFHNDKKSKHKNLLMIILTVYIFIGFSCFFTIHGLIGLETLRTRGYLWLIDFEHYIFLGLTAIFVLIVRYYVTTKIKDSEVELMKSYRELIETKEVLQFLNEEFRVKNKKLAESEQKLYYLAFNDPLTGLQNRERCIGDLNYRFENELQGTTFYLDIDKFDMINNIYGHAIADRILIGAANRLEEMMSDVGKVYRINSDKFGIIIDTKYTQDEVEAFAEKIMGLIARPFEIEDKAIDITTCIAVTLFPDHGYNIEEILNNTDIAMRTAKRSGRGTYAIYDRVMYDSLVERQSIEDKLRTAIANDELKLCYQPQIDTKSKKVLSLETLLRWHNKELGNITPDRFIPVAEESKLIISLGDWVINKTCMFIKELHKQGHCDLAISVNVSVVQLTQEEFVDNFIRRLQEHEVNPSHIEIEITESVFMESYKDISNNILRLREIGVKIALDDFGKGYSSLGHLAYLPITTLKIDKCFIDGICSQSNTAALTGSIIHIGHSLGLEVVAEGVENEEQIAYLEENNCDKIQGYIYSKPLPEDQVIKFVEEFK
jgi:diguanylate cyclase (GGDEF)-like protein